MDLDELQQLLEAYNRRHPEFRGFATAVIFDDLSGHLVDFCSIEHGRPVEIEGTCFYGADELEKVLEEK